MKKLRILVLAMAVMLMAAVVGYAADESSSDITVVRSASLENTTLLANEAAITPYGPDNGLSLVIGTNVNFRFNITGGGSNYGWMKILGAEDDTVYDSAKVALSGYSPRKIWEVAWKAHTAAYKDGKPLPLGSYRLVSYVGDKDGNLIDGEQVHTATFTVVSKAVPLTELSLYNTANDKTVTEVTLCPNEDAAIQIGPKFTPANATGYRNLEYTTEDTDILDITYIQGYAVLIPKKEGIATVTLTASDKNLVTNQVVDTKTTQLKVTVAHTIQSGTETVLKEPTATRAGEAKGFCPVCGKEITYALSPVFTDTDQEYYFDAVDDFYANKFIRGISATEFGPNVSLSRAMVVTILHRMEGSPAAEKDAPFTDLSEGLYYVEPVAWAAENKIVEGIGNGIFAPDQAITRQDLATILLRYAEYKKLDINGRDDLKGFQDTDTISDYAKNAVAWCVKSGIINGIPQSENETLVAPQSETRRCDAVTMLYRFRKLLVKQDGETEKAEDRETNSTQSAAPKVT